MSKAALEALTIVADCRPFARSGIEFNCGSASDSAIATLLERGLIEYSPHHLFVTTRAFLELAGLLSLDNLPLLASIE
jgi:chromosome segregation and condensation protein ScpB